MSDKIDFTCRVCGVECTQAPDPPARAVCEEHCDDHDYHYDKWERAHICNHCGKVREWEPCEDDVGISFAREPGEPLGTPMSKLSTRPGEPGYEEWLRICRSWGYD